MRHTARRSIRRPALVASLVVTFVLTLGGSASAAVDPFGSDELDLVAYADQVRAYSAGVDVWEVWICDTSNGGLVLDPRVVTDLLNLELDPYFVWMSDAKYQPAFTAGGTVTAGPTRWPDDPFDQQDQCQAAVQAAASGTSAGALIVVDVPYAGGFATSGFWCEVVSQCPTTFPDNSRWAVVGGSTVTSVGGNPPALRTIAHELGHAIALPHSFGGEVTFLGGLVYEYDNAMDVMSGGDADDLDIGTIALNRYAAGWLEPFKVRFHRGGSLTYRLAPIGAGGVTEMLVLPTDDPPGVFDVLGARVRVSYDGGVPKEGIEVYHVDQRPEACGRSAGDACWGVDRRTSQAPVPVDPWTTAHVHAVGESFTVRGMTIEVLAFDGREFTVRVTGNAVSERFVDDNGNPHESNIEAIANAGVTTGCNIPTDRFCPAQHVTRAEMAAFLLRSIGDTTTLPHQGTFSDVPAGRWYTSSVERLAQLGISVGYGDGTFRPDAAVSRAEMAVFLTRAFAHLEATEPAGAFADVPVDAWYAGAAEGILGAGVTTGCATDPLRFCPAGAVAREAMASFLARTLGI